MTTRKTPSAASFAAEAQRQFGELKSALKSARAELDSLNRSLHAVTIKTPRTRTPKSTSGGLSSLDTIGANIFGALSANEAGATQLSASFQKSASQSAGQLLDAAIRGQRIR